MQAISIPQPGIGRIRRYSFEAGAHIHRLDKEPLIGTTTALGIIDKAGLTWWASGMACAEFGWVNPKKHTPEEVVLAAKVGLDRILTKYADMLQNDYKSWIKYLDKAYRAHHTEKGRTAELGTNLHFGVEQFIKSRMTDGKIHLTSEQLKILMPFIEWSEKNVKKWVFSEMHCYSERLWCGGIVDLAYIDMQDRFILGDVKSAKDIFFSNVCQLGGYTIQLEENGGYTADGDRVFKLERPIEGHAIFHFGGGFKEPAISYRVERNKRAFESALSLYKEKMDFDGEFAKAA